MKIVRLTETQKQAALLGAICAFFLILGVSTMAVPSFEKIRKLKRDAGQVDKKLEVLKDIRVYEAQVRAMEKGVRSYDDRHLILGEVTAAANQNKMEVSSIQPEAADQGKQKTGYKMVQISFQGRGQFGALMGFLSDLEKKEFPVSVQNMDIRMRSATRGSEAGSLEVGMLLSVLMFEGKE